MIQLNNIKVNELEKIKILLCFSFLLMFSISHAQPWSSLSRLEKDSIIFQNYDKGEQYLGIGFSGSLLTGGWHGFSLKLEPTFGYFLFNRQLISCSILFEKAKTQYEEQYKKSQQLRAGITYRYYLPEKMLHLFFSQVSFYGGVFNGKQNQNIIEESITVTQMTIS